MVILSLINIRFFYPHKRQAISRCSKNIVYIIQVDMNRIFREWSWCFFYFYLWTQSRIHKHYEFMIVVPKFRTIYYPVQKTYWWWQNKMIFIPRSPSETLYHTKPVYVLPGCCCVTDVRGARATVDFNKLVMTTTKWLMLLDAGPQG